MEYLYIGMGSNIAPEKHLRRAAAELRDAFKKISFSSVYRTAPLLYEHQEAFLNAVARTETDIPLKTARTILQTIERHLHKSAPFRYGPRTIDLDLLLHGEHVVQTDDLTIPHPRMHERRFVLEPLCEFLDPHEKHPSLQREWKKFLDQTRNQPCKKADILL